MTKGKKTKTIIYKTLHRKLEIEQHKPHNKTRGELGCPGMKNTSYSTSGNRRANYHRVCNQSNTTGTTSGAGTATPPEHLRSPPVFSWVRVSRSLVLCVMFCILLFVLLSFFFWPLRCLSFFDVRILITPFGIFKLLLSKLQW